MSGGTHRLEEVQAAYREAIRQVGRRPTPEAYEALARAARALQEEESRREDRSGPDA